MITIVCIDELCERLNAAIAATLTGNTFPYVRLVVDGEVMKVTSHLGNLRYTGTVTIVRREGDQDSTALVNGSALAKYLETVDTASVPIKWYDDSVKLYDGCGAFTATSLRVSPSAAPSVNADAVEVRGMPWDIAEGLSTDARVRLRILGSEVMLEGFDGTKYCSARVATCGGCTDVDACAYITAEAAQFMARHFDAERSQFIRVGVEYIEVSDGKSEAVIPTAGNDIFPAVHEVNTHIAVDQRRIILAAQRARAVYGHLSNGRASIRIEKTGVVIACDWFSTSAHSVVAERADEGLKEAKCTVDADALLWALRLVDDEEGNGIGIALQFGRLAIVGATRVAVIPEII
jgi:hypothetical protein